LSRGRAHHFSDFDLMCGELLKSVSAGDVVLVKASRGMRLERVFEFLKEKAKAGVLRGSQERI
jgi:UDP-N-acetylmuramoyl-tripeptide--D-alanyl-D-alanine ligase